MTIQFPYTRPETTQADLVEAARMIELPYLTQGSNLIAFEAALCERLGAKYAVVCNSGTAALHLAYMAVSVGPGQGLLTTPITFLATANAARMCGAEVTFADVDPRTGNVTAETVAKALDQSEDGIGTIAVTHMAGRPCDMPVLRELASGAGCALIEDAAHAPLANYLDANGTTHVVGAATHSDAVALSFHAIKHAPMGEGGAVMTNDPKIAKRVRALRNHGMIHDPSEWQMAPEQVAPWYYEMHQLGWNYRATEFECALGRTQLPGLQENIEQRHRVAGLYQALLEGTDGLELPTIPNVSNGHAWHLYPVAIDFERLGKTRGQVMQALLNKGVGTQVHYIPLYRQPYYKSLGHVPQDGAEAYYERTLSLPMYAGLAANDLEFIADSLKATLES